jgi:hypothetical protein
MSIANNDTEKAAEKKTPDGLTQNSRAVIVAGGGLVVSLPRLPVLGRQCRLRPWAVAIVVPPKDDVDFCPSNLSQPFDAAAAAVGRLGSSFCAPNLPEEHEANQRCCFCFRFLTAHPCCKEVCYLSMGRVLGSSPGIVFFNFLQLLFSLLNNPLFFPCIIQALKNPVSQLTLDLLHSYFIFLQR